MPARPAALAARFVPAIACCALTGAAGAQSFHEIGFLPPGFSPSLAYGVAPNGSTVVGVSNSSDLFQAFHWTDADGLVGIGSFSNPGGFSSSQARATSNNGVIVGVSLRSDSLSEDGSPFIWTAGGGFVFPGNLGGSATGGEARDVTRNGSMVVGYVFNALAQLQAFRWTQASGPVALPAFTGQQQSRANAICEDGNIVVGSASLNSLVNHRPVKWTNGPGGFVAEFLPARAGGGTLGFASDITPDGTIIVGTSGSHAVTWTASGVHDLGTLPNHAAVSFGTALSADASVVVGYNSLDISQNTFVAVIWDAVHGMRDLNDVLRDDFNLDLQGFFLSFAMAISDDGSVIAGTGFTPAGDQEAWVVELHGPCTADFNQSGSVDSQDFFDFLTAFFAAFAAADINHDGSINSQDFFDFLTAFFAGCP